MGRVREAIDRLDLHDPSTGKPLVVVVHVLEFDDDEGWRPVPCGGYSLVEPTPEHTVELLRRLHDAPEMVSNERMTRAVERAQGLAPGALL